MIRHQTFTKMSGMNREDTAVQVRQQAEDYINHQIPSQRILTLTESWTTNSRFDVTIWFEWDSALPPPSPQS
jgi:hypothetical protein